MIINGSIYSNYNAFECIVAFELARSLKYARNKTVVSFPVVIGILILSTV